MKNLKISVSSVKEIGKVTVGPESFFCGAAADTAKKQELTVTCDLLDCENEILLTGSINGTLTLSCSRCLEEALFPVNLKICASFPSTQEVVDLEGELNQLLMLNLPMKPLCRDDCKGLCPVCGSSRNIRECSCSPNPQDPRWDKLRQILK